MQLYYKFQNQLNILKVYDKLKVITKVKKRERYLKHAKPCNRCDSRERERERAAFYTNRQEENKINKVRVGADSTLKNIYKNKKESIMLEN